MFLLQWAPGLNLGLCSLEDHWCSPNSWFKDEIVVVLEAFWWTNIADWNMGPYWKIYYMFIEDYEIFLLSSAMIVYGVAYFEKFLPRWDRWHLGDGINGTLEPPGRANVGIHLLLWYNRERFTEKPLSREVGLKTSLEVIKKSSTLHRSVWLQILETHILILDFSGWRKMIHIAILFS